MTKEQEQLVIDNHNFIYYVLNRLELPQEEYYDIAAIGMCKAAMSYNEDKSKFITYAYRCICNEIFQERRKCKSAYRIPEQCVISYDVELSEELSALSLIDTLQSACSIEDEVVTKLSLDQLSNILKSRDKQIITLLMEDYTQNEIAQELGISQSYVSRIIKKIKSKLE